MELRLGEDSLNPNDEDAIATGLVVAIPANGGGGAHGGGVANREDADPRSDPADAPAGFLGGNDNAARGRRRSPLAVRRRFVDGTCVLEIAAVSTRASRNAVASGVVASGVEKGFSSSLLARRESRTELSLPRASLSLVDGADEVLFAAVDGLEVSLANGLGVDGRSSARRVGVDAAQIDDQDPRSAFPVLAWHDPKRGPLLRATLTTAPFGAEDGVDSSSENHSDRGVDRGRRAAEDASRHPAMCLAFAPGGIHVRAHEPTMWRLVDFARRLRLDRLAAADDTGSRSAGRDDPVLHIDLFRVSPLAAKITFKPAPDRRPAGLGPAVASVLAFLNLDRTPVRVGEFRRARERARASRLVADVLAHVKGEVLSQALAVLASVNHLGNVAGTLDQFGETIRGLETLVVDGDGGGDGSPRAGPDEGAYEGTAMDDLTGGHKNVVTGALVGGGELAKGVLGGVGGIFTKGVAGFQKSGLQGLAQGTAQGVVGAATSTAAGAVGFAARVVEGIDATVGMAQDGVKGGADAAAATRRRLPLAVRGDGVVRPYSRDDARGLHLLRTASTRDAMGARARPFASGRFEDALPTSDGSVLLLSHTHVGVVHPAEERVAWIMTWARVASTRLGDPNLGESDAALVVQARGMAKDDAGDVGGTFKAGLRLLSGGPTRGATSHTRRVVPCQSRTRAAAVLARVEEVWAAARASGGAGGGGGGGF